MDFPKPNLSVSRFGYVCTVLCGCCSPSTRGLTCRWRAAEHLLSEQHLSSILDASNRWMSCHVVYGGIVRLLSNVVRTLLAAVSTLDNSNPAFRVLTIELSSSLKSVGFLSLIRMKSFFHLLDLYNVSLHHMRFPLK